MAASNQLGTLPSTNDVSRRNHLYSSSLSLNKLHANPVTGKALTSGNFNAGKRASGTPGGAYPLNHNQNPINVANPAIRKNLGPLPNIPKAQRRKPKKFVHAVAGSYEHMQDPGSTYNSQ